MEAAAAGPHEHEVSRSLLVGYVNELKPKTSGESFVTPVLACKAMDFIYLLKYRTAIDESVSG
jgi:hypothetical protein